MDLALSDLEQFTSVKHGNLLIESMYRMEANEQKLILLASKIANQMGERDIPFTAETEIVITAADFAREYGISRQLAFKLLCEVKNTIYQRSFIYFIEKEDGTKKRMRSRWVHSTSVEVHDDELDDFDRESVILTNSNNSLVRENKSEVTLMFAPAVIPFIYRIKREYTLLDINEVGRLKSKYAIRLYKILMKWRNAKHQPNFSYQELRVRLGLTEREYPLMADFKKRVLNVAVDQINKGTGFIELKAIEKKIGNKITGFSFKYTKYDNDTINITPMEQKPTKKAVESKKPDQGAAKQLNAPIEQNTANNEQQGKPKAKRHFSDGMTEPQSYMFANQIVNKIMQGDSRFMYLASLATEGMGQHEFINQIAEDFMVGRLEPYAKALEILKYKHHQSK